MNDGFKNSVEVFLRLAGFDKYAQDRTEKSFSGFEEVKSVSDGYSMSSAPEMKTPQIPVQSFSLSRGVDIVNAAQAPAHTGEMTYPELTRRPAPPAPDALETFYHNLELDARMSSQLLREGELYE